MSEYHLAPSIRLLIPCRLEARQRAVIWVAGRKFFALAGSSTFSFSLEIKSMTRDHPKTKFSMLALHACPSETSPKLVVINMVLGYSVRLRHPQRTGKITEINPSPLEMPDLT